VATNTLWQQSEKIRQEMFPLWFSQNFNVLTDLIERGEVERVGERDYRIPFQLTFGGRGGHYDPQLGDMGRGSSPTGNVMFQSFYTFRLNFEFDMLQIKATSSKEIAKQNPFLKCVADGARELVLLWDKIIHRNGTAALATTVSFSNASGVTVYTCDNLFGTQLLRRGQYYTIYDPTLTTAKSSGVLWATQINTQARQVTLSGVVPGAATGDIICFEGVSGPQPVGPRGLQYWINPATSGVTAGINRAQEIQIVPKVVDGTNGLNVDAIMALYHRLLMDRGAVAQGIVGCAAPAQQAYVYNQMMALQMNLIEGDKANAFDRLPRLKGKKIFMWGDVTHYVDIHQDQTAVPYIVPSDWGRAQLAPTGFFETPGKSGEDARFIQLYAGSGAPAAGVWFGLTKDEDLYSVNPGEQGLINNLPLAAFYQ